MEEAVEEAGNHNASFFLARGSNSSHELTKAVL